MKMQNEKIHSIMLALVGGYLLYLAYQLFDKYRTGTEEMPGIVFILAIAVFAAGGIGTILWAWRIYRQQRTEKREKAKRKGKSQNNKRTMIH